MPALGRGVRVEHVTDVLCAHVGDLDRDMIGVGCERCFQAVLLASSEALLTGTNDVTDAQRVDRALRTDRGSVFGRGLPGAHRRGPVSARSGRRADGGRGDVMPALRP